jgi:hypothetical protein
VPRIARPSPAMAVALVALFVALGGTGYAVARIDGRQLRNATVSGAKLRKNTLGGREVRESRLGRVPRAARADTAARALAPIVRRRPRPPTARRAPTARWPCPTAPSRA